MQSIKSNEEKPKLYITQPSLSTPTRTMQSYYHSRLVEEASDHQEENQRKEEGLDNKVRKKSFQQMTIEEKIIYFSSMPFQAPKVKCQIVSNDKSYIGIIQNYDYNSVKIKVANKPKPVSVVIDQITEINLIGF